MDALGTRDQINISLPRPIVERALRDLLSNRNVRLSERNRRFLHFVVQEALAGRGDRIKAYSIGVDVFGRGEDFDPNVDPIVRIEATRLRSALEAYYNGPGALDAIKIVMRPGSYIPALESAAATGFENDRVPRGEITLKPADHAVIISHATNLRDKVAHARGALWVNTVMRRFVEEHFRVFLVAQGQQRATISKLDDIVGHGSHISMVEFVVHEIAEGKRYAWSVSNFETGELRSVGDIDRADDGIPSASMISALTESTFRSIVPALI